MPPPPEVIQCFFQCADRYASVYSQGATGLLAEYAVKKYRSHRSVCGEIVVWIRRSHFQHEMTTPIYS